MDTTRLPAQPPRSVSEIQTQVLARLQALIWTPAPGATVLDRLEAVQLLGEFRDPAAQALLVDLLDRAVGGIHPADVGRLLRDTALDTLLRAPAQRTPETVRAIEGHYRFRPRLGDGVGDRTMIYDDVPVLLRQGWEAVFVRAYVLPLLLTLGVLVALAELLLLSSGVVGGQWTLGPPQAIPTPMVQIPETPVPSAPGEATATPTLLVPASASSTFDPLPEPLPTAPTAASTAIPAAPTETREPPAPPTPRPQPLAPSATSLPIPTATPVVLVAVPGLANHTLADAQAALDPFQLKLAVAGEENDATHPASTIISQDPAPGTRVSPGGTINVVLSKGPAQIAMPGVVNTDGRTAQQFLAGDAFHFRVTVQSEESATFPVGVVMRQEPAADSPVQVGANVTIWMSTGSPATATPAPVAPTPIRTTAVPPTPTNPKGGPAITAVPPTPTATPTATVVPPTPTRTPIRTTAVPPTPADPKGGGAPSPTPMAIESPAAGP